MQVGIEVFCSTEVEGSCNQQVGKRLEQRIVVSDRAVVVAAGELYLILDIGQGLLQVKEVFAGLQVGIVFGDSQQTADA